MDCSRPGSSVLHCLLEFAHIHVHWVSDAIYHPILCHTLLLLPSIFCNIGVFSNESVLRIRWPKYWSFSISPSNEHPGLISFRMDWLDLLAVQGTLKSLLQHHSSKASVLRCSALFMVQLSHLYMTTGKTTALIIQAFVSKVTSRFPTSLCYSVPQLSIPWPCWPATGPWCLWRSPSGMLFITQPTSDLSSRIASPCPWPPKQQPGPLPSGTQSSHLLYFP